MLTFASKESQLIKFSMTEYSMFIYLDQSMSDFEVHPWHGGSGGHFSDAPFSISSFVPVIFSLAGNSYVLWSKP